MGKRVLAFLGKLLGVFLLFQAAVRLVRKLHPFPCPFRAARILENPLRRRFLPPERTLDRVGVAPGMRVLELGPGTGYFTPEAARRVGSEGKLYAVDIQPAMAALVQQKVDRLGLTNVEVRVANAYDLPFADGELDLVFLITVFGEIPDKPRALHELFRVLRPGGALSISELLPDPDYSLPGTILHLAREAGFSHERTLGSPFFYTANFRKPALC